ncbi:MAG: HEAT repeat domain-containing protein [Anaerolineae bacterium]|nr:HEAT repeat domain-containing protein [Anaerolineae bacterium]
MSFLKGLFGPSIKGLKDKDWHVRQATAKTLGKAGYSRAVDPLIAALHDDIPRVREAVTEALGQIGTPAVKPLITALEDRNEHVRYAAIKALGQIGDKSAVMPITAALKDKDRNVALVAARTLGQMKDTSAIGALAAALKKEHEYIRINAAQALGQIGDKSAVESLIAALEDKHISTNYQNSVRAHAARALDKLGWQPDEDAVGAAYWIAKGEWGKCAELGTPAIAPLTAMLGISTANLGESAAQALSQIGVPAIDALISSLKATGFATPRDATKALVGIGEAAVDKLIAALLDGDESVIAPLGRIGKSAVKPLAAALENKTGDRGDIIKALNEIGAPAVDALLAIVNDENNEPQLRKHAIESLINLYKRSKLDQATRTQILELACIKQTAKHTDDHSSHTDRPAGCFHDDYPASHSDMTWTDIVTDFPL